MPKSIFSFFSGVGLLDLGFDTAGYDIVFVNEFKEEFLNAYRFARQNRIADPIYGYHRCSIDDFFTCSYTAFLQHSIYLERNAGNIIGFVGGPPCPDFSIAGKNRGRNGENGILAQSYVNLITQFLPDFFVFENVKGLVKTERHRVYFDELKQQLQTAGYYISDQVLNALSFGVPQDRDRIILVGIHENFYVRNHKVTPMDGLQFPWLQHAVFGNPEEIKAEGWKTADPFRENSNRYFPRQTPNPYRELCVETWFRRNHVDNHPNTNDVFRVKQGLQKMQTIPEGDVSGKSFKRLHRWRYSPTAAYGNNEVHLHPYRVRRLSVAEAMAIQSIPDWFALPANMTLSNKFKVIGNGVPVLMATAIAQTLSELLDEIAN